MLINNQKGEFYSREKKNNYKIQKQAKQNITEK